MVLVGRRRLERAALFHVPSKNKSPPPYCIGVALTGVGFSELKKEAAPTDGFKLVVWSTSAGLFQLGRNAVELGIQGSTNRIHGRDNHDRNASSDQTIFNRGGPRI